METVKHPISDRVFTFCGFEPYQRKDGSWTELKVWEATCRTCKQPFTVKTPAKVKHYFDSQSFNIVNCPQHKGK